MMLLYIFLAVVAILCLGAVLLRPKGPYVPPEPPKIDPYYNLPYDHPDHPDNWGQMQWYDVGR